MLSRTEETPKCHHFLITGVAVTEGVAPKGWCTVSAAFDMGAWMRGETPFYMDKVEPAKVRYCGVFMTRKGPRSFIVKTREAVPDGAFEIHETTGDPKLLANELLKKYAALGGSQLDRCTPESYIGQVGVHADGEALHTAICVGLQGEEGMLLFLTSHSYWNPYARALTPDEAPLTGYPWNNVTFLAPVFRRLRDLHWQGRSLPTHRVKALREEFFKSELLSRIACL